jgi:hypothetical protein
MSKTITDKIDSGDLSLKPGWIRLSLHPTMTDDELLYITDAIKQIVRKADEWGKEYIYDSSTNEFNHKSLNEKKNFKYSHWFDLNS